MIFKKKKRKEISAITRRIFPQHRGINSTTLAAEKPCSIE
jgi:hypothetical protein